MARKDTEFPRFVEKLASDPAKTPAMTVYMGYLGPSDQKGMVRIYGSPALSQFTEVAETAILHSEPISGAQIDGMCAYWVSKSEIVSSGAPCIKRICRQAAGRLSGRGYFIALRTKCSCRTRRRAAGVPDIHSVHHHAYDIPVLSTD